MAIIIVLSLCACASSEDKLVGNWVCEESIRNYPDQMTLYEDGTGIADGRTCSWTAEDGVLKLLLGFSSHSYDYEIQGSVLYLNEYAYNKK